MFEAFYRCYEDIFNVDCEQWPSKKKTIKLLSELFGPNTTLFHERLKCLNTDKDNQQDFL